MAKVFHTIKNAKKDGSDIIGCGYCGKKCHNIHWGSIKETNGKEYGICPYCGGKAEFKEV
jgi:DNA-directed RNA polymerase subunit RPC12/RpoP